MSFIKRDIAEFSVASSQDFWPELVEVYNRPYVKGVVIYEVLDMCSSKFGERKAVAYALEDAEDHLLTCHTAEAVVEKYPKLDCHLASTIKWPVAYCEKELTDDNAQQTVEGHPPRHEADPGGLSG